MPLSLRPLRCPHCRGPIGRAELADKALRRQLIARQAIACPHCQGASQLPAEAEKLISIGLLLAMFGAPLGFYWGAGASVIGACFGVGVGLILWGAKRQQLIACADSPDHPANPDSSGANHEQE